MNHLGESQFVGRELLRRDQRLLRTGVIDFNEQQASFHSGYVERQHARGVQIELLALVGQCVPHFHRIIPWHPDLIAEIAGITGARNVDRHSSNFAAGHTKVFQVGDIGVGNGL